MDIWNNTACAAEISPNHDEFGIEAWGDGLVTLADQLFFLRQQFLIAQTSCKTGHARRKLVLSPHQSRVYMGADEHLARRKVHVCRPYVRFCKRSIAKIMEEAGCFLKYLPPYSPDLNKVEYCWHTLKSKVRMFIELVHKGLETLENLIGKCLVEMCHCSLEILYLDRQAHPANCQASKATLLALFRLAQQIPSP